MADRWKLLVALLILAAAGCGIYFSLAPRAEQLDLAPGIPAGQEEAPAPERKEAEQVLKDSELTVYSKDESVRWELRAEVIERYADDGFIKLTPVKAEAFTRENGELRVVELTADRGEVQPDRGDLVFSGGVWTRSFVEDTTVSSDSLFWDGQEKSFQAEGDVKVQRGSLTVKSRFMTGDQRLERLVFDEEVWAGTGSEDAL